MTQYWFRPKRYGYGATPTSWEGWAVTLGVVAVVLVSILAMKALVGRSDFAAWIIWAVGIAAVTFWFVRLARRHTEGEWRWRWGETRIHRGD